MTTSSAAPHAHETIRVLHVEDDSAFADLTATFLRRVDDRFDVEIAPNASDGLDLLAHSAFDCIVSDHDMPGPNGIEFLKAVREDYPDLPFILFTGKGSEEVASDAISAGVDDYLQKGSGTERYSLLANRIDNLVSQYRAESKLETRAEQQRRVAELGNEALAGASREALFDRAVEIVADTLDNEYANVLEYRPDQDDLLLRAGVGWRDGLVGQATVGTGDDSQAGYTLRSEEPIVVENLTTEERFRAPPLLVEHDVISGISVIIGSPADPWGVLDTHTTEQTVVTEDDIDFVQAVANTLANAIEQHRIETQLRETREWYQRIIEHLSDHVIIVDESGEITYCSPPVERQMGYTPEEVIGTNAFEYVHPDDQETAAAAFAETLENSDKQVNVEYRSPAKDGTYRWIEARGANYLADPVIQGVLVSVREITERKEYEQELERYKTILETIDDIAFVVGEDWTVEYVSPAIQEYVDVSLAELEGRPVMALAETYVAGDDDPARFEAALTHAFASTPAEETTGGTASAERLEVTLNIDGDRIVFEYQFSPMVHDGDDPVGVVITMREITHRKEREQRLQKTTSRLEALYENSPDMIDVLDPDGTLLDVNQRFCAELGYEEDDLLGRPICEIDQLVDKADVRRLLAEFDPGERRKLEGVYERRDGSSFPVEVHLLRLDVTSEDRFLAISRNITERTEFEHKITALHEAAQDLFQANTRDRVGGLMVEAARDILGMGINGVAVHDEAENVLRVIAQTDRSAELLQTDLVFHPGESLAWEAFETGELKHYEDVSTISGRANPDTPIRSEIIIPLGEHGVVLIGSTDAGVFDEVDISLAETLAAHAETALDRIARDRELKRQNDRLEEFASVVSHDLQNPLNVARGRLELAQAECSSEHLNDVADALERSQTLIDDLLSLARDGTRVTDIDTVDVGALAENCWDNVATGEASIWVDVDRAVRADQSRLQQLLENLYRNAIEHGGDDVAVTVGVLPEGFYIEDDGPGIPVDERDDVFNAGYSTTEDGTGFGLSIVQQVVDAHGWDIRVTDGADGGARFEITGVEFSAE